MTDKHIIIFRAIGIAVATIVIVALIMMGHVLYWHVKRIEREVYVGGP